MSKPLTYPSLTCVLEYLEANNRYSISYRCPALRKIEKSIPLHINHLRLDHSLMINNQNYRCKAFYHKEHENSNKQLFSFLFGERCTIQVKLLKLNLIFSIRSLPIGLKLRTRQIQGRMYDIQEFLPFLDIKSIPLEHLALIGFDRTKLQLPIVKASKKLTIDGMSERFPTDNSLLKLSNREIVLKYHKLPVEDLITFIQKLLNEKKEIGTSYTFDISFTLAMYEALKVVGKRHRRTLNGQWKNKEIIKTSVSYSISLPINSTSELYVHGYSGRLTRGVTKMEVVSIRCQEERA